MSFDTMGPGGLDYFPCRYDDSKLLFRGPKRDLDQPYIAFMGGTQTYGRFVERPFVERIEGQIGYQCVNLGCPNAGIDVFYHDHFLRLARKNADITVLQVTSPRNMSNRFYRVHPRRNDRFVKASPILTAIYRDVDFSQFNFTKHMVRRLNEVSNVRFKTVVEELQTAWVARMRRLMQDVPGRTVLLWMSDRKPESDINAFGRDPWFVTQDMISEIANDVDAYVEVIASEEAMARGTEGMVFSEMEAPAANALLGPLVHEEVTDALAPVLRSLLQPED